MKISKLPSEEWWGTDDADPWETSIDWSTVRSDLTFNKFATEVYGLKVSYIQ